MATVLFDVGHTIIDDPFNDVIEIMRKEKYEFLKEVLPDDNLYSSFFDFWIEINFARHISFGSHFMQEEWWIVRAFSRLVKKFKIMINDKIPFLAPEILLHYRKLAKEHIIKQTQIKNYSRVLSWLKDKNVYLGVASDDREFASRSMLEWTQLISYMNVIFVSEALSEKYPEAMKPNSQFYNAIVNELKIAKIDKGPIIFVGDSESNDIVPASNFGMLTVRCFRKKNSTGKPVWLDRTEETIADHKFSDPDELFNIFARILNI